MGFHAAVGSRLPLLNDDQGATQDEWILNKTETVDLINFGAYLV